MDSGAFQQVLEAQRSRYPLMQPQDYGKLAYQSEFGPEHLVKDREQVRSGVAEERAAMSPDDASGEVEYIGNALCRLPLSALEADGDALLADLFCRTAQEHRGTAEGLEVRLRQVERWNVPGFDSWLATYRAQGCPAVHHSQTFREAYRPHYRLLRAEYADYFPVLLRVYRLIQTGKTAVVSIDGRCGSGKTRLARLMARLFPCNVFHMDDFYLPMDQRPANWQELPGGNMDFARFQREVLTPVRAGRPVTYRPYSCPRRSYDPATKIPPRQLNIVEGSYSQHAALAEPYELNLFLTCSPEEQRRRLQTREGDHFSAFLDCWIPMEERYFQSGQRQREPTVVDTSAFFSRETPEDLQQRR